MMVMQQEEADMTSYAAKIPDAAGFIDYTAEEDAVWRDLVARQRRAVDGRVRKAGELAAERECRHGARHCAHARPPP